MATNKPTRKQKRADLVFAAEDPFSNIVRLETYTWNEHVLPGHPEVQGTEATVKNIIQSPDTIHQSGVAPDCAVFQASGLAAFVYYETSTFVETETFGRVATVYPQPIKTSTLGALLYPKVRRGTE